MSTRLPDDGPRDGNALAGACCAIAIEVAVLLAVAAAYLLWRAL